MTITLGIYGIFAIGVVVGMVIALGAAAAFSVCMLRF